MPRILHIGKYFSPFAGGIENFLADLISVQNNHQISALVHDHQFNISHTFASILAEPWQNQIIYRAPSYGRVLYAPISPHFPIWLNHVLAQFNPDLLHIHLPNTSAFWCLFSTQARHIPWVIHWHADVISTMNKRLSLAYHVYRLFEQRLLAHAKAIIATSPPYLSSSLALETWQNKCHVIPLGISQNRLPEADSLLKNWANQQWSTSNTRILTIGRLTYYKGHEILIQAMTTIKNAELIIVGQGEEQTRLEKLITELQLASKVKLYGHCTNEQLVGLLDSCDCFCLPSLERTEAFGVVLMEAMRYQKPIVASAISGSGVTWVVKDQITGLLTPPGDVDALAHTLRKLVDDKILCQQYGQAGYQRFKNTFIIEQVETKVSALYQHCLI